MEPLVTGNSIDIAPGHVIAIVVAAVVIGLLGVTIRRLVMAYGDELKVLLQAYGPVALTRLLGRRRMPQTPWFCLRCHSHNARGHARCYSCGAARAEAAMPAPNADVPAGPSAGRSQRTRR